jgi:hypothetical protein
MDISRERAIKVFKHQTKFVGKDPVLSAVLGKRSVRPQSYSLRLENGLREELEKYSKEYNVSINSMINTAIKIFIYQHEDFEQEINKDLYNFLDEYETLSDYQKERKLFRMESNANVIFSYEVNEDE